jgi:tRNA C32,U32 (ribose-2'-O)-methylase TrmJ
MISEVNIVLVRTEYSSNAGASARAMGNMGGEKLIFVNPQCDLENERAKQAAAGAQKQFSNRIVYADWGAFYAKEHEGYRIALSRRGGRKRTVKPLDVTLKSIKRSRKKLANKIYLFFGPEADGLEAEDLSFVHECCHLPVYGEFASYNLAQAVLLGMFITRQTFPLSNLPPQTTADCPPPAQPIYFPDEAIKDWLNAMGFNLSARRASAYLTLKRLLLQKMPTQHELQVLEAIIQQNIRKLRKKD